MSTTTKDDKTCEHSSHSNSVLGWHFLGEDRRLRYEPFTKVYPGQTILFDGEPALCERGLHASKRVIDALQYAPGPILCRIELSGKIVHGNDKMAGQVRKVLWMVDARDVLRDFTHLQALSVAHLWDAPPVVIQYLRTGNKLIQADASYVANAAWNAAWNAAASYAESRAASAVSAASYAESRAASAASTASAASAVSDAASAVSDAASAVSDAASAASYAASAASYAASAASPTSYAASPTSYAATRDAWDAVWDAANQQLERMAWMLYGPETAQM